MVSPCLLGYFAPSRITETSIPENHEIQPLIVEVLASFIERREILHYASGRVFPNIDVRYSCTSDDKEISVGTYLVDQRFNFDHVLVSYVNSDEEVLRFLISWFDAEKSIG